MNEWIPLALGFLLGLGASRVREGTLRGTCLVIGSVSIGLAVSAATGELAESIVFFGFDTLQALLAAVMGLVAVRAASRWRWGQDSD